MIGCIPWDFPLETDNSGHLFQYYHHTTSISGLVLLLSPDRYFQIVSCGEINEIPRQTIHDYYHAAVVREFCFCQ